MFLTLGVDNKQNERAILFKIDILSNNRAAAIELLSEFCSKLKSLPLLISFGKNISEESQPAKPTVLFGFSARFFKGPLTDERDRIRHATRFDIKMPVPYCLRQMRAREDNRFKELCSQELIAAKESDILILFEFSDRDRELSDLVVDELKMLHCQKKINLKSIHEGFFPPDGIGALGVKEGISNLQDVRARQPDLYREHIFVRNAEAGDEEYDGGSYLVFRKYNIDVERWFGDALTIKDNTGTEHCADKARNMALGRSAENNLVVDGATGRCLESERDEGQTIHSFDESHIKQANPRGKGKTNFGAEVSVKNARILRRSFSCQEIEPLTGKTIEGLLFLCFQKDIQSYGFEFIHNEWLMSRFYGGRDRLLDPESKIVEPVDGCYYFCPPFSEFPGDVFFNIKG